VVLQAGTQVASAPAICAISKQFAE